MRSTAIPAFDDLLTPGPERPARTAWGVFGSADEIGTINYLTPDRVLAARTEIVDGAVHSLNWDYRLPSPHPIESRQAPRRVQIKTANGQSRDDFIEFFYPQWSTQWDALRHIRLPQGFYNGFSAEDVDGGASLGIHRWAAHGIVGRGVLIDVASHMAQQGSPLDPQSSYGISPGLLDETLASQNVRLAPGDILLLRTGWIAWYEQRRRSGFVHAATLRAAQPGIRPGDDMAAWIWDHQIAAFAADNCGLEAIPPGERDNPQEFLHAQLIAGFGLAIGELFQLDGLASHCAETGRYTCFVTAAPMNIEAGVGSPGNALAIT